MSNKVEATFHGGDEEPVPDVVLTFRDGQGREWLAAGYLGDLERYSRSRRGRPPVESRSVHSFLDESLRLTDFKVIKPPSGNVL